MQIFYLVLAMVLSYAVVVLLRFFLRKKSFPLPLRILAPFAEIVLSLVIAYLTMVALSSGPLVIFVILMGAYLILLVDGLVGAVMVAIEAIAKKKSRFFLLPTLSFALILTFASYGIVSMEVVGEEKVECTSEKIHHPYSFAFLADLHVGKAQPFERTAKTIQEAGKAGIDFMVIGGDLVDAYTSKDEMVKTFSLLGGLDVPVYFVHGNHEITDLRPSSFTLEEMVLTAQENGVHVLEDEFVPIGEDLMMLGRMDMVSDKRKEYKDLVNPNPTSFLLTIDHQPTDFAQAADYGIDLQLSGHTHDGQLFPLGWFYPLATYPYGDYWRGASRMFVSPGASGWAVPLRTQGHCRYQIVHLNPRS